MLSQFNSEGAHEPDDTVFGRDVVAGVGVGLEPSDRAGQDDGSAATAGQKMGHTGFHGFPHPGQVDVDHLGPVFFAGLVQSLSAVADSGVGHDDVEPAELLDAAVDRRLERVVIAHVDFGREDPAVVPLDQVGGLGEVLGRRRRDRGVQHALADGLADVDGDDVGALLRQSHRMAAALTARRSGDQGDFALNTSGHGYLNS